MLRLYYRGLLHQHSFRRSPCSRWYLKFFLFLTSLTTGRFYSYLATILAQRLSDRETAIQKEVVISLMLNFLHSRAVRRCESQKKGFAERETGPASERVASSLIVQ